MKIICFIDNLGSGGAQRQLTTLAVGLKRRGHQIRFLVYHPQDHFLPVLQEAGIPCEVIPPCPNWKRFLAVRRILRIGWQDVVLAFLEGPCWYAEMSRIPSQSWGLVAGERLADPRIMGGAGRWLRHFHRLADAVVCNSHTNCLMLEVGFPFLGSKLATIYNTLDLELFQPGPPESALTESSGARPCRIVVVASYHAKKNMLGVAKALVHLRNSGQLTDMVIDWYGAIPPNPRAFHEVKQFIEENELGANLRLHPPTKTIEREYATATAVGLFSFFEGLPNVVCEAMACGKPVLLSYVCDAGNLVTESVNGFLCDPGSPESIALALQRFVVSGADDRRRMGAESRRVAVRLFTESAGLDRYEKIMEAVVSHKAIPTDSSWPGDVPESAIETVRKWADEGIRRAK